MVLTALGLLSLAAWFYLVFARGGFWLGREREDEGRTISPPPSWPSVAAVTPARDEADVIAAAVGSLLGQDYPGPFRVVLVDDHSGDGTAAAARAAADRLGKGAQLEVIAGAALPSGWTGKLWALSQGVARASESAPDYLLLTDADIRHDGDNLRRLVSRAEEKRLALTTLMVRLHCGNWAERTMIPAFVYFFQMLFPFAWANNPRRKMAAGAGGCMLVRRAALERIGGVARVRDRIIDDCALAAALKRDGPIWIGLTAKAESLRPYRSLREIGRMIARSAYAQLGYSPLLLVGTVLGLALVFLAPVAAALFAQGLGLWAGAGAWGLMAVSLQPTLRLYGLSPFWGVALPVIALIYLAFTVRSAVDHWAGRGGMWKGRAQAMAPRA